VRRKVSRKARRGATAQRNTAAITAPPLSPREIVFHAKPAKEQRRKENRSDHCTAAIAARNYVFNK